MANAFITAERVVRTALGLLEREIVLPRLVWRDAGGNFTGAKDETISIRLPAYATSRKRTLDGGTPITVDDLTETKVDVTLTDDVYKAVNITDEDLTLRIEDFGTQVLGPVVRAVARGVEDEVATLMSGATYQNTVEVDTDDPYNTAVDARRYLNDAQVPFNGRAIVMGSAVEAAFLKSPHLNRVDQSGSDSALRDAEIGRIAGFGLFTSNALDPDEAYAFHQTAYVLSTRAPVVPDGATWGSSETFAGLAMRALRDYDFLNVRDRLLADVFVGSNTVSDRGTIGADGKFAPSVDGTDDPILVRAVKLTMPAAGS